MVASTSAVGPSITNATSKTMAQTSADAQQDRFLKLLVAQLNNQDPMNPMDNAQMTSQMAQINTVSGINQLNETVKSLSSQFNTLQALQGTALIGHDVLIKSNTLTIESGKANGSVELTNKADNVKVEILTPGGKTLDTITLGPLSSGRHAFTWDASSYTGTGSPTFKVTATSGGKAVETTALARDTVVSIGSNGIQLKGRDPVYYDEIQGIL
jgi:flagellar basal-body rod modification protein FlgD